MGSIYSYAALKFFPRDVAEQREATDSRARLGWKNFRNRHFSCKTRMSHLEHPEVPTWQKLKEFIGARIGLNSALERPFRKKRGKQAINELKALLSALIGKKELLRLFFSKKRLMKPTFAPKGIMRLFNFSTWQIFISLIAAYINRFLLSRENEPFTGGRGGQEKCSDRI